MIFRGKSILIFKGAGVLDIIKRKKVQKVLGRWVLKGKKEERGEKDLSTD